MAEYMLKPLSGKAPRALVLFLHGVGANGRDLLSLGEAWQQGFPDVCFVSVDAPHVFDMASQGEGAFQWFSLRDFSLNAVRDGVMEAAPDFYRYLDDLQKRVGVSSAQTFLCGFSQGAMMALYAGLRTSELLGGVIAYAGILLSLETLPKVLPPITLIHGDADMVVPVTASDTADVHLTKIGAKHAYSRIRGLGHGIDNEALARGAQALHDWLNPA
jgi:phospholipase/carboxylesterase